jgi:hypothetical protein
METAVNYPMERKLLFLLGIHFFEINLLPLVTFHIFKVRSRSTDANLSTRVRNSESLSGMIIPMWTTSIWDYCHRSKVLM